MQTDRGAIARNWVLAQEKRKREQEEREAEYWAKRPMAYPWKVEKEQPPPGWADVLIGRSETSVGQE